MKKKLLVSFSGGETSAFMAQWLWNHKIDEYEMIFVFANTGQENEETLEFINNIENKFFIPIIWIEAEVKKGRVGTGFKSVDFLTASREGDPFENVIRKYGIPNKPYPHCTRELKLQPIKAYAKYIGWVDYYTAIGIRSDEFDRMSKDRVKNKIIYPLISMIEMTKPKINFYWSQQEFRLNLKGYEGNCKWCWKKSDNKLRMIAKDSPSKFNFPKKMEKLYGNFIPPQRNQSVKLPITFFRSNRSAVDILNEGSGFDKEIIDDSLIEDNSCDIYSECGIDN